MGPELRHPQGDDEPAHAYKAAVAAAEAEGRTDVDATVNMGLYCVDLAPMLASVATDVPMGDEWVAGPTWEGMLH